MTRHFGAKSCASPRWWCWAPRFLLIASQLDGPAQTAMWATALVADYLGTMLAGASGVIAVLVLLAAIPALTQLASLVTLAVLTALIAALV